MAVYDRPGNEPDRGNNTLTRADGDELRQLTGIGPDEEKAMEDSAYSGAAEDIAEHTKLNDSTDDTNSNKPSGDGFRFNNTTDPDDGKLRSKVKTFKARLINKKTAIGGGVIGLLIGGGFGILSIVSGPAQILQFASLIERIHFSRNSNSSESRVGRFFEYFRASAAGDQSLRNVSYTMEKISNRYRDGLLRDGIKMEFERPTGKQSRRLQGLTIDTTNEKGQEALERLARQGYKVEGTFVDLNTDINGKRLGARQRRQALKVAVDIQGKGKASSAIAKRLLIHRAGVDFHPFRNLRWDMQERFADWRMKRKEKRAEKIRNNNNPSSRYTLDGADETQPDGTIAKNEDSIRMSQSGNSLTDESRAAKTLTQRLQLAGKFMAGGAAVIGALCTVKGIGEDIEEYKHTHINLVLIRQAMGIVTAKSQIQSGIDVTMDEIGVLHSDFYDEETGTSVESAPAVQAAYGNPFSLVNDVPVKPSDTNEKPELFNIIDRIPVLGTACRAQDGIINGLKRVPVVGHAIRGAESVASWGIDAALGTFGWSQEKLMQQVVAVLAGDIVDPFAKGAELGGNAMIGGLLAANDVAIAAGGVALDIISVKKLDQQIAENYREEFRQKGFFARMFDVTDTNSFIAKTFLQNPSFMAMTSSLDKAIVNLPASIGSLFSRGTLSILMPRSAAATYDYDYGVDVFGFSEDTLEDERYADPYENARIVEEELGLATLNERYGKCFANTVDPSTFRLITGASPSYETVKHEDCTRDRGTEAFDRYRIYLLDTVTAKSLACYEGIDESACNELGFGARPSDPNQPNTPPANPGEDTSNQICPADPLITDGGIAEKYGPGKVLSHRIRLCIINNDPNFDVNVSIAQNMANMVRAAQQAGINLTPVSSAYRTYDSQVDLRRSNGCPDISFSPASACSIDTARPGESNHEEGLAIDFSGIDKCPTKSGNRCVAPGNTKWEWLEANARQYGLNPLRTEAWHWSVTGR